MEETSPSRVLVETQFAQTNFWSFVMKSFLGFIFLYLIVLTTACNKTENEPSEWVIKSYKADSSPIKTYEAN